MPILAVDQFGHIYQTDPDREDGLGVGYFPGRVYQNDVTLGAAYLTSQKQRTADLLRLKKENKAMDAEDEMTRRIAKAQVQKRKYDEARNTEFLANPEVHAALQKKALQMGCQCEYSTPMSGNVMTANGQNGRNGLNRDQRVMQDVAMGNRHSAYHVDPAEEEQYRHRMEAQRILRVNARR
jgi:hypothetical protein